MVEEVCAGCYLVVLNTVERSKSSVENMSDESNVAMIRCAYRESRLPGQDVVEPTVKVDDADGGVIASRS